MARESAVRITMKLAKRIDLADLQQATGVTRSIATLKDKARELGFTLEDTTAKTGSFDFEAAYHGEPQDEAPDEAPEPPEKEAKAK